MTLVMMIAPSIFVVIIVVTYYILCGTLIILTMPVTGLLWVLDRAAVTFIAVFLK